MNLSSLGLSLRPWGRTIFSRKCHLLVAMLLPGVIGVYKHELISQLLCSFHKTFESVSMFVLVSIPVLLPQSNSVDGS
jgi:hypothetical protein